jgi:energy-coupling factor transporter ATP-binding protein EcfA2
MAEENYERSTNMNSFKFEKKEKINVTIENCNNVTNANIEIIKNELNLKYALNGTGKSSISKAIAKTVNGEDISIFKPFGSNLVPKVEISQKLNEVLIFDEDFVNNTVFKKSEVIENGFEVFIKNSDYDRKVESLNEKIKALKIGIEENDNFIQFTKLLNMIAQKLKLNSDGISVKNDTIMKSLTNKENIFKVPAELEIFKPFLQNNDLNIDWIDWKTRGEKFDQVSGCPFCTKELGEEYEEQKDLFKKKYKKSSTKNLKDMLDLIEAIKEYLDKDKYELIINCIKRESDVSTITQVITKFRIEIEGIIEKFERIIQFNQLEIKREQIGRIGEILKYSKIKIEGIDYFKSDRVIEIFNNINDKINELEKIVDDLKKEIGAFVGFVLSSINNAKKDINFFLKTAGINYELEILQENTSSVRTILKYVRPDDESVDVENIRDHLSWGEKNAFSLVLFMHYALSRKPDLIILDDPISSFDDNKKYAIINRLFGKHAEGKSFYNKTVLMLSHDFEPIIDFIINNKPTGGFVNAEQLWNRGGKIINKKIEIGDVDSWINLLKKYSKDDELCIINRLAFLRKYIELHNDSKETDSGYQIISSLQHGYHIPQLKNSNGNFTDMDPELINLGISYIKKYISDFDYDKILSIILDENKIKEYYSNQENNYLKLQIFRTFLEISGKRDQIKNNNLLKYIDETYHIENDYIYFLDLVKYEIVPDHIIEECDKFILN